MDFLEAQSSYHSQDAPGHCIALGVGLAMVVSRAENMVIFYRIL